MKGLNFDINGVSSSKTKRNFVYGLPKGHSLNEKTASTVLYLILYTLGLSEDGALLSGK